MRQKTYNYKILTKEIEYNKWNDIPLSGIGEKYARNIWLDVYHPDFHNNVAIDDRIKKITQALGYSFGNYQDHEKFYLDIARESGINGWELDRLLYNYTDYFLQGLNN